MKKQRPKRKIAHTRTFIKPGEYYEDCSCHPCLCTWSEDSEISGISLIDGSEPRSCDIEHCGVTRLTFRQALRWKFFGPPGLVVRARIPQDKRWWPESFIGRIFPIPIPKEFLVSASGKPRREG